MSIKLLFHAGSFHGGGFARIFDDYKSMYACVLAFLAKRGLANVESGKFGYVPHDFPKEEVTKLIKARLPKEHLSGLGYTAKWELQTRYVGSPYITIAEEKPMVIDDKNGWGANEIRYYATLAIEVRAMYTTEHGEVKEEGKPHVPARKQEYTTEPYVLLCNGEKRNPDKVKYALMAKNDPCPDGFELYRSCFWNGSVQMVNDEF